MMKNPKSDIDAILITGPTASGKSALALDLARRNNGVVINADSMQVYDTLRVVTARPSEAEMDGIVHHLYGHVPVATAYSTGDWLREISSLLADLRGEGKLPVIVGGTGLYFKALTGGLSNMPSIPDEVRERLRRRGDEEGAHALHAELAERDPVMGIRLNPSDLQRVIRALEVLEASGRSILEFQDSAGPMIVDPTRAAKLVVQPERSLLHARINSRFARMMDEGAVDEVRALLAKHLPADRPVLKAIGVQQIADMLAGRLSREEAIERASAATRQYAKRQMTWFRNQMDDSWTRLDHANRAQSFL
ncbi:tRNA (adenosine(37)-N6)-dimethylallyltransferase MiaA [Peteryoungia desertarenae]|uniref:tRNA dimethylallyltransferase n=1 Tax=Peteryoungia desertarenae TaxID=1813451 RepID=A0ABX6QRA1_9HYPH|nr:tRNA (adenosine(37)-N6)-dimethylallyltransferase MiaA [Peteryoungia desertarenae]QLF70792.1 tRNA (adenosine(37)-N6)-dimethylallyltransferase MiaA [Peteryoungia desertarenae]